MMHALLRITIVLLTQGRPLHRNPAPQHVAGSASELAAPTQPVRDASRISELFCDDLERDVTIQLKGQDQPLQLVVPLARAVAAVPATLCF